LEYPDLFTEVKRAWAIWTSANQSFGSMLGSTWRCDFKRDTSVKRLHNKRECFTSEYAKRLEKTQIECRDALYVISSMDMESTFFYCDPPYFNSHMGHYKGYTERDFEALLQLLSQIKGKFLLSSYPSELLEKYSKKHKWFTRKIEMPIVVHLNRGSKPKMKTEVLTANYEI
jgi:DNA adenine methylase